MKTPPLRFSLWLFLILLIGAATAPLWHLMRGSDPAGQISSASARPTTGERRAGSAERSGDAPVAEPAPKAELTGRAQALSVAKSAAAQTTGLPELDAFNAWTARYLAASVEERKALVDEGISLATARRSVLAKLIPSDPRRAVENAVSPVVRQELPAAIAARLEERVNERAFFGVLGVAPSAEVPSAPAYRREVRTDDGGHYRAFVYGQRNSQPTTASASIVGIAVDDVLAIDERPLRIVASGEIPNHPNNLTRRRTVVPLDEKGFTLGREVREAPAPPRDVVETCPVSGKSTSAPKAEDGGLAAVTSQQVVVESGGQFHFLCSGGHILGFEQGLIAQEGGNGGPSKPTNPPAATQSTGYKSHLLMRVAFSEALKGSVTEKEGSDLGKNVQDWFVDTSFGALTFLTTVSPLIVLPRTEAWYKDQDTGSAFEVLTDARAASKAAGFDPANFDFDTVIYTGSPGGFGGQAYVGGKGCWLKSGTSTGVAAHEYGHNFSLWHSNFWSTTNGSVIGGGSHVEYGDSFDTMGSASAGDYHFNAFQKNLLNWMPTTVVHDVAASGTYRIYPMDQPAQDPSLRYAMKIRKDAARNYWVDLRQKFASNAWVQSGVFLHWSPWQPSGSGPHLLDTTPGSPDGKNDAPLVVGRTFSDVEAGIHITPIAKNGTSPVSMDVVVNMGAFAGNQAPTLSVAVSATSVATGIAVNFAATASDPDGDALSYAWDFGDKSFSTSNAPAVSKSWAAAGEYRVRCTVSDMKGRTVSSSVIITVGSPVTFRIAGTITAGGLPLRDVRVSAGSREAYTDSDGTYTLVGLAAGTNTVATQLYGYALTPTGSASVTVGPNASGVNFTATNLPLVSIAVQDGGCSEGANTGTFRISRTGSTASALTVNCNYPGGTAVKPTDYSLTPDIVFASTFYTLTIPAGQAFLDVVVTAVDDVSVESFETARLDLFPSTSYVLGNASATITITDSDTALPLVRMLVSDRDAFESGDPGQFVIERLGSTANALSVSVALSGTATNGSDYVSIPTTITIPAGASSVPVNVTPLQDTTIELMETVTLTINTNAAYIRAASSLDYSGTVNLYDDDTPTVTVVATDSAAAEAGNDPGVFTVTRTGGTSLPLTVNYGMTGSALHGTDYAPLPGVLTIPAGSSAATVVITPIDDAIGEPAQTAVLQLRSGTGYTVGAASSATVTITDNTDLPYVTINETVGPAIESGTTGTFRITTTGTGSGNITVGYTVSGTATNGTDYSLLSGTVSMGKNTTINITITPIQDAIVEGYETITLTLNPDPTYSLALDSSATMILQDDDLPQVSVSETDDFFSETTGNLAKFFVSRTGATTNALTVNYTLGGTATSGVDYTAPSGTVTVAAGATGAYVDVSLLTDAIAEGTETIVLNVTLGGTYASGLGSATRYIADTQSASVATQVRFSASSSSVGEGAGTVNIPVTLSAAAAGTVTVEYFINGGTALGAGIDYRLTPGVLTFAPGEISKAIAVTITDDTLAESSETLIIGLGNPNNARLGTSSHTLTITDNDSQPAATVGFAAATGSGLESVSPAPIAVFLSSAQAGTVAVDYAVTGGTATSGTDYAITNGTLTFAAGETVKIIPNTITNENTPEPNETIILTLSNPVGAALGANTTHTYTILDDDTLPAAPVITSAGTATGTVGVPFSYQIVGTNTPVSYNATGLPAGLSVNTTTGLISGTPTVSGTSSVALSATNAGGTGTATLTLTVNPPAPVITSPATAIGTNGQAFSYQIVATNVPTTYNATGLPAGLSVNTSTGLISGTPAATGISSVTLSAKNAAWTGTATLALTVNPPVPVITSAATASGTVGTAFSYQIVATNSPTSYNATGLPAGLSVNTSTGLISGTPTGSGISSVTLSATNAGGTGTATLTLTVNPPAPVITSAATASGTVGTAFSYQIVATNSPTSYNATGLSAGLSVNTSTGLISGTPTGSAVSSVTLGATNAGGTGTATLTLTVNPPAPAITSAATASGTVGSAFSYQIVATNSPTSYNATGLPAGLSVNTTTGLISGTPTGSAVSSVTLGATNAGGTGTATLTLTVTPPAPVITSAAAASGTVGTAFSYQIVATNSPTSYDATSLPAGLSVNTTTGLISGTPTGSAVSSVTLSATNAGGTVTATLTLTVTPPAPVITSAAAASGTVGAAFSYQIAATNSPTSYDATGLPAGLSVNTTTGLISGTPTGSAVSSVTLGATNAGGTGAATLTLTVNPPAPAITSAATASGTVGEAFSYQIVATNSPTSYDATGLPAGLSVNTSSGLISGTPTGSGVSSVTLGATNAGGTVTGTLTLTVNPPAPVITSAVTATGTTGQAFSYQIVATNSPTSYDATGLPAGLSVNTTTGLISGTPTGSGVSSVTLSATNAGGTGTATLTLTVNPPAPVITSAATASGTVGTAFSYQIVATNSPTSYDATGLPAGLSVNTTTGLISGTPTGSAVSSVTLSATNAGGTVTGMLTLTVNPQPTVQFTSASQSASESVGTMTITAQISAATDLAITVPFTVTGTASNPADYTRTNSPLTIPAGQTSANITITVVDEAVNEANETVIVTMGTPTNASKGATSVHTATIIDNDRPTVQFTSASQNALESVGAMIVTAQLSAPTNVAVTVPFTVSGTASKPSDYTISASPLTIPAGQTTGKVTITVVNDAVSAPNETVIITMGTPTNANKGATSVHTATIIDNDTWPTVQFTSASQSALESVGTMTVTVQLSAPTIQDVTIPFTVSGTARNPSDYAISTSPIIIPIGQTSANITVSVVNDATSEGSETIIITMGTPTGATKVAPTVHTATIIDNDNADLASLIPSVGTLMPAFVTATTSYSAGVAGDTATITVTPTVANGNATVTVNGLPVTSGQPSSPVALNVGSNTITTVVTAQNGTTKRTYTLVVSRAGATNADLLALVPSAGTLSPAFISTTLAYTASISNSTLSIQLTPVLADPAATVTVNGAAVVSGTPSNLIILYVGSNVINTVVTAPNGTTTRTYKLTVNVTVNPAVAGYYMGLATPTAASTNPARQVGLGAVSVISTGAYTGKITLGGSSTPVVISGTLATGTATTDIARAGLPTLTLALTLADDAITGTLTEGTTVVSALALNKLLYASTVPAVAPLMNVPLTVRNPATDKGAYTAILQALTPAEQGLDGTAYPQGSGWVTMNVAPSGLVTVSGRLGDGQTVSYSNYLSKDNVLPFFISPYSGTGTVSGLVSFRDTPGQSDVDGLDLVWFKVANASDTSYRNGWPNDITQNGIKVDLFGSKFIAPTLANVTAQIALSDGNLASASINQLSVNAASQVTVLDPAIGAQNLAVTLATNGSFTGSFRHPVSNKSTAIGGVILQKTQSGSGYFMGLPATGTVSQSGAVTVSVP